VTLVDYEEGTNEFDNASIANARYAFGTKEPSGLESRVLLVAYN
jgi:hypothetical protein